MDALLKKFLDFPKDILYIGLMINDSNGSGRWLGAGIGIGAAIFALTNDPVWIGVGTALGAAIDWTYRK